MPAPAELAYEEVVQGDSWKPVYTLTSGGSPVNLSEVGADAYLYLTPEAGGEVISRHLGGAGEAALVTDGTDGRVQFVFTPEETEAMALGWYLVRVVYTKDASEIEITHARGAVNLVAA